MFYRIETQNQFLKRTDEVQRYVEVGPARILATMAKKTAAQHFSSHSSSYSSHLRFLSCNEDRQEVYYEYPENDNVIAGEQSAEPDVAPQSASKTTPSSPAPTSVDIVAPQSHSVASAVPDVALSASHILLVLVAQKLKRSFEDVSMQKTIRELSGGS